MGVRSEYTSRFGREELTIWSGPFSSNIEAYGWELPGHDGYMFTSYYGNRKVRVQCETPRTDENFHRVDAAIMSAWERARSEMSR